MEAASIRLIRDSIGRTQAELARLLNVSTATVQQWEQGRRQPHGPACVLLTLLSIGGMSEQNMLEHLAAAREGKVYESL